MTTNIRKHSRTHAQREREKNWSSCAQLSVCERERDRQKSRCAQCFVFICLLFARFALKSLKKSSFGAFGTEYSPRQSIYPQLNPGRFSLHHFPIVKFRFICLCDSFDGNGRNKNEMKRKNHNGTEKYRKVLQPKHRDCTRECSKMFIGCVCDTISSCFSVFYYG